MREGAITHRDSLGNSGRTGAGDVQVMRRARACATPNTIWKTNRRVFSRRGLNPTGPGGPPGWAAKPFPKAERSGRFVTLASGFANEDEALPIRAAARVLDATLKPRDHVKLALDPARHAYLVPAVGTIDVNGVRVNVRDGAAICGESDIEVVGLRDSGVVVIETV